MSRNKHIYETDTIFKIANDLRNSGVTVGLTHGTFDLLHPGHLHLLEKTSKLCDFLFVGVDSDRSTKSFKGNKRPIMRESHRHKLISELNIVDFSFILDTKDLDMTYVDIYSAIKPTTITYGRDFIKEDILKEEAAEIGADVVKIANDSESTTRIIRRILKSYYKG